MKENKKVADSIFVDLFQKPENFLSLYNALSGRNLKFEETVLRPKRLKNTMYKGIKNNVSMEVNGRIIVLIEHQSSVNKNMPLRFLMYVARIYEQIVPRKKRYVENLVKIPTPDFYVIYSGEKFMPENTELKLSSAFLEKPVDGEDFKLELKVPVINVRKGNNLPVKEKCDILKEYSLLIDKLHELRRSEPSVEIAYQKAVEFCTQNDILKDYIQEASVEIMSFLCAKYDEKEAMEANYEDGYERGMEAGIQQGILQNKIVTAFNFLRMGLAIEQISAGTGLSIEEINELVVKKSDDS